MAGQIFVKVDGVDGESEDGNHGGYFDAESFDFGGSSNFDASTFRSTGGINYDVATFTVKHDKNLATLFKYMNENVGVAEITVDWRQQVDGGQISAIKIVLNNVKIISVHSSLQDEDGIGMNSMFTIGFSYGEYSMETASHIGSGGAVEYVIREGAA